MYIFILKCSEQNFMHQPNVNHDEFVGIDNHKIEDQQGQENLDQILPPQLDTKIIPIKPNQILKKQNSFQKPGSNESSEIIHHNKSKSLSQNSGGNDPKQQKFILNQQDFNQWQKKNEANLKLLENKDKNEENLKLLANADNEAKQEFQFNNQPEVNEIEIITQPEKQRKPSINFEENNFEKSLQTLQSQILEKKKQKQKQIQNDLDQLLLEKQNIEKEHHENVQKYNGKLNEINGKIQEKKGQIIKFKNTAVNKSQKTMIQAGIVGGVVVVVLFSMIMIVLFSKGNNTKENSQFRFQPQQKQTLIQTRR